MDQSVATTGPDRGAERASGRLLIAMTYVAVVLLVIGVVLGSSAILAAGIVVVIATPIARVVGAAISFGSTGQWRMVAISVGILVIIAFGTAVAIAGTV